MEIKSNKRKIVNLNYSFWVSLPMIWIRNHNIGKGDQVLPILQENGDLVLRPIKNDTIKQTG